MTAWLDRLDRWVATEPARADYSGKILTGGHHFGGIGPPDQPFSSDAAGEASEPALFHRLGSLDRFTQSSRPIGAQYSPFDDLRLSQVAQIFLWYSSSQSFALQSWSRECLQKSSPKSERRAYTYVVQMSILVSVDGVDWNAVPGWSPTSQGARKSSRHSRPPVLGLFCLLREAAAMLAAAPVPAVDERTLLPFVEKII